MITSVLPKSNPYKEKIACTVEAWRALGNPSCPESRSEKDRKETGLKDGWERLARVVQGLAGYVRNANSPSFSWQGG